MTDSEFPISREEVAIVGMAGRFPDAADIDGFWDNLRDGKSSIRSFSDEELRACGIDETVLNNAAFVSSGVVLDDADCFDAAFFGFSPLEAEIMDPQQRVFLECAWETLENAGYDPARYSGAIGVFGGVSPNLYFQNNLISRPDILGRVGPQLVRLSNEKDHVCTRVAFKLNLKGPGISVNTACSSSGVALHLAYQSVLSGECDMALVGGARIEAPLKAGYLYEEAGILSPDGQCRVFDADARGTVFGNGVGIILIKRLSDAIRDGDTIHAVIKGTAINNDGAQKAGYAAPSIQGQSAVIEEALAMAEISAETIGYVEAHGTGTTLGDPIEIAALSRAYSQWTDKKKFCPIGSVKTNIGHLFAGAGIMGVIKAVLAMKHRSIPPSLNFKNPNPQIDFENSPFYVNDKLNKWESNGVPRRAGVSSFGVGGTNSHVILEEAPELEPSGAGRSHHLLLVSATSENALDEATERLAKYLKTHPDINLADVAYTLQLGRSEFNHRRMLVVTDLEDAVQTLETHNPQRVVTFNRPPEGTDVVFMFSGQGSQYANMGLGLYQTELQYRQTVDRCCDILVPHLGLDLRDILFPTEDGVEEASRQLQNTQITQPALFTVEYALAKLWMSWGIRPSAIVGHSIGEYVAACLAGVFSLEDALSLVAARGRLIQQLPGGSMLAVSLSEQEVETRLDDRISIAAVNGPEMCVVSGDNEAVGNLEKALRQSNVACRYLHTSHAFHSIMIDSIMEPFREKASNIRFSRPQIPIVSTVTGKSLDPEQIMSPDYWTQNLRQTVRFSDGLQELMRVSNRIYLEVGPGQTLSTLAKQHPSRLDEHIILSSIRHPHEKTSDLGFILKTLGWLWFAGLAVDWQSFYRHERRQRVALPAYPFERRRYWIDKHETSYSMPVLPEVPAQKAAIDDWFHVPSWKRMPLARSGDNLQSSDQNYRWLVFADKLGFADELIDHLKQSRQQVIRVEAGSEFGQISEDAYSLNPHNESDYQKLIQQLATLQAIPDKIVHCWSLTDQPHFTSADEAVAYFQERGFTSLLYLAKTIGDIIPDKSIDIKIISNDVHEVTGDEKLVAEKATVMGPCRVIPQEYDKLSCVNIDIEFPKAGNPPGVQWMTKLLNELVADDPALAVAYRGKHRWVQDYEAISMQSISDTNSRLRADGVYLITGGLGGIGLVAAEFLAQRVSPKLALMARTPMPDRHQWDQWLQSHGEQDGTSRKIQSILALEAFGAQVMTISADVADSQQMAEAIAHVERHFGKINGVIHSAGIAGGGLIQLKTIEAAEQVLAPKVRGTLNLDRLLGEVPLDFFILCSSLAAVRGGSGQVDYCAANAFLDAYAHQNYIKHNAISINWGMWQKVGMGVNTDVPDDLKKEREERLEHGILPEEGKEALARILGSSLPQVVVNSQDNLGLIPASKVPISTDEGDNGTKPDTPKPKHARPNLSSVYVVPGNSTEQSIADIWQQLLGIENVGIHDNFFDLGGHSILGSQLIERMRATFGVKFPLSTLFEKPTVHSLSQMILDNQAEGPSFAGSSSRGKKRKARLRRR